MVAFYRNEDGSVELAPSWTSIAERRIQDAVADGAFDRLPGAGKPQDLRRNPFEGDLELGHRILKNAGCAPDWIERGGEADRARQQVAELRSALDQRLRRGLARLDQLDVLEAARERRRLREMRARLRAEYLAEVRQANRLIDSYNLTTPFLWLHKPRLIESEELAGFDAAVVAI